MDFYVDDSDLAELKHGTESNLASLDRERGIYHTNKISIFIEEVDKISFNDKLKESWNRFVSFFLL